MPTISRNYSSSSIDSSASQTSNSSLPKSPSTEIGSGSKDTFNLNAYVDRVTEYTTILYTAQKILKASQSIKSNHFAIIDKLIADRQKQHKIS